MDVHDASDRDEDVVLADDRLGLVRREPLAAGVVAAAAVALAEPAAATATAALAVLVEAALVLVVATALVVLVLAVLVLVVLAVLVLVVLALGPVLVGLAALALAVVLALTVLPVTLAVRTTVAIALAVRAAFAVALGAVVVATVGVGRAVSAVAATRGRRGRRSGVVERWLGFARLAYDGDGRVDGSGGVAGRPNGTTRRPFPARRRGSNRGVAAGGLDGGCGRSTGLLDRGDGCPAGAGAGASGAGGPVLVLLDGGDELALAHASGAGDAELGRQASAARAGPSTADRPPCACARGPHWSRSGRPLTRRRWRCRPAGGRRCRSHGILPCDGHRGHARRFRACMTGSVEQPARYAGWIVPPRAAGGFWVNHREAARGCGALGPVYFGDVVNRGGRNDYTQCRLELLGLKISGHTRRSTARKPGEVISRPRLAERGSRRPPPEQKPSAESNWFRANRSSGAGGETTQPRS